MQTRLGIFPDGFRAPGGFSDGITQRPDIQLMLISLGYKWGSNRYPAHPVTKPGEEPTSEIILGIVKAQKAAQPFIYPSGLVEVPASPITDVVALRMCRWSLKSFQKAIRESLNWALENRMVFDFTCHPSVSGVVDPGFETLEMVLEIIQKAGDGAAIVDLGTIAQRAIRRGNRQDS